MDETVEGTLETKTPSRGARAGRTGVVTSDKADKTIRVVVDYSTKHPLYGKYIRRRTVLHVHDEKNEAKVGDRVEVVSCRPRSKMKRWRLVRIVGRRA
jgi:small subunit ribosomal protein S17